jgi:hypothetical protein
MPTTLLSFEKPDLARLESILQSPSLTNEERTGLEAYKRMIDPATGNVRVEHTVSEYGRHVGHVKRGQIKTHINGATMRRVFRNLLFGESYDDLDIANASGSIMCQLFQKHGLDTENMAYLNENREEALRMIMDHYPLRVERATAKKTLIEVFNGGSGHTSLRKELPFTDQDPSLPPFVDGLKLEIKRNVNSIATLPAFSGVLEYVNKRQEAKGKEAWFGQFAATLYQDEERKCIEVIAAEVEAIGRERKVENPIGSMIFDGLTVRKELEICRYIQRLERCIEKRTDYTLKLEIKAMVVTSDETAMYIGDWPVELSYEAKKARFEKRCFKTKGGKLPFHTIDEDTGELVSRAKEAFAVEHEDWIRDGRQFLGLWFADPTKRCYKNIDYSCVRKEDRLSTVYYAFPEIRHETLVSWSSPEDKQANVAYFLDYVRLIVEDNPAYVEWMVMWLADILVNPHDKGKTPIAVVLWGQQGAGKTFLRELLARLLGNKLVHHTDDPLKNGDVLHDFNATLKFKLLIEFEEINFKTHSKVADRIKALITGHTHTITLKGADSVDVKATERALFTTNTAGSVVIESGDRRYAAFAVSTRRVGQVAYWDDHYGKLRDDSYIKDVAEYLLSFGSPRQPGSLASYNLRDKRPITAYYRSLQELSCAPELDFLRDMFLYVAFGQEFVESYRSTRVNGLYEIPSSHMCAEYNRWRMQSGLKEQISNKSFTMKMVSHGSGYGISRDTTGNRHNTFLIDADKIKAALALPKGPA